MISKDIFFKLDKVKIIKDIIYELSALYYFPPHKCQLSSIEKYGVKQICNRYDNIDKYIKKKRLFSFKYNPDILEINI